jgi:hypothetical protein
MMTSPRVGKEIQVCKYCKKQFRTLDLEWAHMTRGQKLGYLINEWAIVWLLVYGLMGMTMLMTAGQDKYHLGGALLALLFFGVIIFSPMGLRRWFAIRKSIARLKGNELANNRYSTPGNRAA